MFYNNYRLAISWEGSRSVFVFFFGGGGGGGGGVELFGGEASLLR